MNEKPYPYIPIGQCAACGQNVSLNKDVAKDEFCQAQSPQCSPLGCLARYGQARYDQGRKMRAH